MTAHSCIYESFHFDNYSKVIVVHVCFEGNTTNQNNNNNTQLHLSTLTYTLDFCVRVNEEGVVFRPHAKRL